MSTMNVVFNKLEKFNGTQDMTEWFRNFERCCLIAGKTDNRIKGQLLMLFIEGQPKAILEELEEVAGEPQTLDQCKTKLRSVFDTVAVREDKMATFEQRIQNTGESEDEFMFALVRLFKSANPDADQGVLDQAVKRKFLQGIDPVVKRGIFVFCQDPYANNVSRDRLLQDCRKAKVHLAPSAAELFSSIRENSSISTANEQHSGLVNAISELTLTLTDHMKQTTEKLAEQDDRINAVTQQQQPRRRGGRFRRCGFGRWNSNANQTRQQQQTWRTTDRGD